MRTKARWWWRQQNDLPALTKVKFKQVDAFTRTPLTGNPAAVVLNATALKTEQMQAIAREMNLSETTFVLPATTAAADYRVRFFGLRSELPFAGHPTIATVHAVIEEGKVYKGRTPSIVRQESQIGVVPISVEKRPDGLFYLMTQASPKWEETGIGREEAAQLLGCGIDDVMALPAEIVDTGVRWIIIPLTNLRAIKMRANMGLIEQISRQLGAFGITTFCLETEREGCKVHLRSYAPAEGVQEDPVDGTGNGSVGAYIAKHALLAGDPLEYTAEQGSEVLRDGLVTVRVSRGANAAWTIQVGGYAATVIQGEVFLAL